VEQKDKDSVVFLEQESNGGWYLSIEKGGAVTVLADNFGLTPHPVAFPVNGTVEEQAAALGLPPLRFGGEKKTMSKTQTQESPAFLTSKSKTIKRMMGKEQVSLVVAIIQGSKAASRWNAINDYPKVSEVKKLVANSEGVFDFLLNVLNRYCPEPKKSGKKPGRVDYAKTAAGQAALRTALLPAAAV